MIHRNSLEAYKMIMADGSKMTHLKQCLQIITGSRSPIGDYDVLQKVKPGSDNLNLVRPRITELYKLLPGVMIEGPPTKSHYKDCNVRTSMIHQKADTQDLFLSL